MRREIATLLALSVGIAGCKDKPVDEGSVDTTLNDASEPASASEGAHAVEPAGDVDGYSDAEAEAKSAAQQAREDAKAAAEDAQAYEAPTQVEPRGPVPLGNPGAWATTNDYPSEALREEREGTVSFRVNVDPSGRVADCEIISSSGHADLDQITCENIRRRARFSPAIGSDGYPAVGSYSNRVRWVIPRD